MAYIQYEYDPDDPERNREAYTKAVVRNLIGILSLLGLVCSLIYFVSSLISALKGNFTNDLFYAAGLIILIAVIAFFILFCNVDKKRKKVFAEKYFLFFFGGALELTGTIAFIVSISSLCHNGTGTELLVASAFAVIFVSFAILFLDWKIEGGHFSEVKLFTDKDTLPIAHKTSNNIRNVNTVTTPNPSKAEYFFCHKCGKKLPADSLFCSSCGAKLK